MAQGPLDGLEMKEPDTAPVCLEIEARSFLAPGGRRLLTLRFRRRAFPDPIEVELYVQLDGRPCLRPHRFRLVSDEPVTWQWPVEGVAGLSPRRPVRLRMRLSSGRAYEWYGGEIDPDTIEQAWRRGVSGEPFVKIALTPALPPRGPMTTAVAIGLLAGGALVATGWALAAHQARPPVEYRPTVATASAPAQTPSLSPTRLTRAAEPVSAGPGTRPAEPPPVQTPARRPPTGRASVQVRTPASMPQVGAAAATPLTPSRPVEVAVAATRSRPPLPGQGQAQPQASQSQPARATPAAVHSRPTPVPVASSTPPRTVQPAVTATQARPPLLKRPEVEPQASQPLPARAKPAAVHSRPAPASAPSVASRPGPPAAGTSHPATRPAASVAVDIPVPTADRVLDRLARSLLQKAVPAAGGAQPAVAVGCFVAQGSDYAGRFGQWLAAELAEAIRRTCPGPVLDRRPLAAAVAADPFRLAELLWPAPLSPAAPGGGRFAFRLVVRGSYRLEEAASVHLQAQIVDAQTGGVLGLSELKMPLADAPVRPEAAELRLVHQLADRLAEVQAAVGVCRGGLRVRVWTTEGDQVFQAGRKIAFRVAASREAWVYLFDVQPDGRTVLLFPNQAQPECRVRGGQVVAIPGEGTPMDFTVTPPFGPEAVQAVAFTSRQAGTRFGEHLTRLGAAEGLVRPVAGGTTAVAQAVQAALQSAASEPDWAAAESHWMFLTVETE